VQFRLSTLGGRPPLLSEYEEFYLVDLVKSWKKCHQEDMARWELEKEVVSK